MIIGVIIIIILYLLLLIFEIRDYIRSRHIIQENMSNGNQGRKEIAESSNRNWDSFKK